jgi:hypothetical protein
MVDKVSIRSGTPGVADGTTHEQATGSVEERESSLGRFFAEPAHNCVEVLLAPVAASCVHLGCVTLA